MDNGNHPSKNLNETSIVVSASDASKQLPGAHYRSKERSSSSNKGQDESDYSHAPPQYSEAVKLPNINAMTSSTTYTPSSSDDSPTTKESDIL